MIAIRDDHVERPRQGLARRGAAGRGKARQGVTNFFKKGVFEWKK